MPLVWKPHQFLVWKLVPTIVGGVLTRSDWVAGGTVGGLLVEKMPREVRDLIDRDSRNPAVVLLDDAAGIELGDRVELDAEMYRVITNPVVHQMGLPTDHARLIVERLD